VCGLCLGWFFIDLVKLTIQFQKEWLVCVFSNKYVCVLDIYIFRSWVHKSPEEQKEEDPDAERAQNRFCVTFQEYEMYLTKTKMVPRPLPKQFDIKQIGFKTVEMKYVFPERDLSLFSILT